MMTMFKRWGLFFLTNILVLVTVSITFSLLSSYFGLSQANNYYTYTLLFCALFGFMGAFISLFISKWMAKRAYGVKIIDPRTTNSQERWLVDSVHQMSLKAKLPKMPEVGIYDSPEINAFATGPSKSNSLVAVSTGLLHRMSQDEVEGVLGHEVAHIANGDMVTMTLIQGVVNTFVMFFARIIANVVSSNVKEEIRPIVHMVAVIAFEIMFAILGSFVVGYFSRSREFRADKGGAKLAGRDKMIASLKKLQAQFDQIIPDNSGTATMKISNKSSGIMALMSTHPSLDKRIKALERATVF